MGYLLQIYLCCWCIWAGDLDTFSTTSENTRSPSLSLFFTIVVFFVYFLNDFCLCQRAYFDMLYTQYTARSPLLPLLFYLTFLFYSLLGGLRVISGVADIVSRRPVTSIHSRLCQRVLDHLRYPFFLPYIFILFPARRSSSDV